VLERAIVACPLLLRAETKPRILAGLAHGLRWHNRLKSTAPMPPPPAWVADPSAQSLVAVLERNPKEFFSALSPRRIRRHRIKTVARRPPARRFFLRLSFREAKAEKEKTRAPGTCRSRAPQISVIARAAIPPAVQSIFRMRWTPIQICWAIRDRAKW